MLEQDPDHALHALRFHGLACELQQVLQRVGGVGGFAEVDVQRRGLAGFGQTQLLGRSFFMRNLEQHDDDAEDYVYKTSKLPQLAPSFWIF